MPHRPGLAVLIGLLTGGGLFAGCSGPERPRVRNDAAEPRSCEAAVATAFPDNRQGSLVAYRSAITQCASLEELARRKAFDGSILRFDCAPADVLAVGREIPQLGRAVPGAPADVAASAVCQQFNRECADYEELRRDHADVTRNPTVANRGLYVHHQALYEACTQRYG